MNISATARDKMRTAIHADTGWRQWAVDKVIDTVLAYLPDAQSEGDGAEQAVGREPSRGGQGLASQTSSRAEAPTEPGEFVLVPREPTEAMRKAAWGIRAGGHTLYPLDGSKPRIEPSTLIQPNEACQVYRAMIAAAPVPPAQPPASRWRGIESAPKDCWIVVYAAPREGLPGFVSLCRWHEDAGFCVDEIREPVLWQPLILPSPPTPRRERGDGSDR